MKGKNNWDFCGRGIRTSAERPVSPRLLAITITLRTVPSLCMYTDWRPKIMSMHKRAVIPGGEVVKPLWPQSAQYLRSNVGDDWLRLSYDFRRLLKNSDCRLLKKIHRRGGILVSVSVKTWSRIPKSTNTYHERVQARRLRRNEAYGSFSAACQSGDELVEESSLSCNDPLARLGDIEPSDPIDFWELLRLSGFWRPLHSE